MKKLRKYSFSLPHHVTQDCLGKFGKFGRQMYCQNLTALSLMPFQRVRQDGTFFKESNVLLGIIR